MTRDSQFQTIISASNLKQNLNSENLVIVDCRYDLADANAGFEEYQASHIPGAIYANLNTDLSGPMTSTSGRHPLPDWNEFQNKLGRWGIDQNSQVVVYDHSHGAFAARLWWMLRALGHEAVAILDGGWASWTEKNFGVEAGIINNAPKHFEGHLHENWAIGVEQIEQNLEQPQWLLIDSRDPSRYRGESEPLDAEAGHIPGAVNHFFGNNLDEYGSLLPADQLRANFEALVGDKPFEDVVFYCGSGVTACHNLMALQHAGISGARLYVGSWSEWSRDPKRPFNTGDQP